MILFVFFIKLFFSLLLFKNTLKNISSERDSGRGCAAFYQLPFFLISSRSYFSFQCISFQMREASEFPLIPIGCKPWQYTVLGFSARNIVFLASAVRVLLILPETSLYIFTIPCQNSPCQPGNFHMSEIFSFFQASYLFCLLFSTALFYCYSGFLVFFHFYLDFPFSYLCDALLTVLNFLFLFYILWIFKSFYLFYNFHFLFMHNILTFTNCKPPFSMISYMLY